MAKTRVYELAKKLGIPSKEFVEELRKEGIAAKSYMSTVDEETTELILTLFKPKEAPPPRAAPPKAKAPAPPAEAVLKGAPEAEVAVMEPPAKAAPPAPPEPVEKAPPAPPLLRRVRIAGAITVKDLAGRFQVKATDLIRQLMEMGVMSTINQPVEAETAAKVGGKFGFAVEVVGDELEEALQDEGDRPEDLRPRAPVVTIMGHVDHGKTRLLDAIRQSNLMAQEAGGITQHIGAFRVNHPKGTVVFLDTPGHEAFTAMRARGAKVADIVVLVVAADDGVMPQTREAIAHARAAGVPIIVAINKVDLPNANPDRVRQGLTEFDLIAEEWGGKTIFCEVSAKERIGIEDLVEMVLLQAEIMELKANPDRRAAGVVVEGKLDRGRGPVATVLVQRGTLRVGDAFVAGVSYGKVRALIDDMGRRLKEAVPSAPVEVLGFSSVAQAGDAFMALS
ncbi:MAG: translation initiation factor IF-2, partial [Nitrospinota bacterium]